MKKAPEMGSGAMTYISNSIKTGSGIQKLLEGDRQTGRRSHRPTLGKATNE
jgi:hypothetical protein